MTALATWRPSSRGKRGAILVGVLWILVFLAFLAVVLRVHMGSVMASVRVTEDKAAARIIAEAGIARGASLVLAAPFAGDGALQDQMLGDLKTETGSVRVSLTNEAWRIDLNTAEKPLIVAALRASGANPPLAGTLSAAIIARRGKPGGEGGGGGNNEGQPTPGPGEQTLKGADPLQTVSQVALIPDMPDKVALGLRRYVTVSSGLKGVRMEELDEAVLRLIPGLPSATLSAILRYRKGAITRAQLVPLLSGLEYYTAEKALTWRVELSVDLPSGHSEVDEALIMISPDDDAPYHILDWRRIADDQG